MCTARKGVKDLPISAQGLPALFPEGLPAVRLAGLILNPQLIVKVYPVKFFEENKRSVFNWGLTLSSDPIFIAARAE